MDEIIYAKSEPLQTLQEHIDNCLSNLKLLKKTYADKIENVLSPEISQFFWDILTLVVKYHDLGKISIHFQNKIRKKIGYSQIPLITKIEIPHNFLSSAFFDEKIFNYDREIVRAIVQAIFYHHEKESVPNFKEIEKVIKEELEQRKHLLNNIISVPQTLWTGYVRFCHPEIRITSRDKIYPFYVLLKGFLHRIDHSSSAEVEIELKDDSLISKVKDYLKHNLRLIQQYTFSNQNKNLVILGSTGIGKTEAGLLWAGNEKTFLTLPLRVIVNAIFDRIQEKINYKNTGLLHSTSLNYLCYKEDETPFEIYKNSKQLAYQVSVSTIDQLFTFPFKFGGYEKILATLTYSKVIIDEIQSYEPKIAAVILKGLKQIYKMGGKFLIMTATLPQIYVDFLEESGIEFEISEFLIDLKRHRIKICQEPINAKVDLIKKLSKNKKVLVITNTFSKARQLFTELKEKGCFPKMLHSLFIGEDRKRLEEEIYYFTRVPENKGIWITTQIAEASLDIDFDILFTELSSLDSLFQRMGRVYRNREYYDEEPNVFIFTENCSGIGTIYDKEIFILSKQAIEEFNEKLITEKDKVNIMKQVYNKEKLKSTKFYKEFLNALEILDDIKDYELQKAEAQRILREIYSVRVIPKEIFEKYCDEIMEKIKIIRTKSNKVEKIKAEIFINDKSLDIPFFKAKEEGAISELKEKGLYVVNYKYSSEEGLIVGEKLSNFV
ncbi:CRISPR-associated helicase Cas3' [Thermodesulfovibrio hydrogeniphilus]